MNSLHDLYGIAFRLSVFVLSSSFLYNLFKKYGLPAIQGRAHSEIEGRATLERQYQNIIQEKLMTEKHLSTQQQELTQLSQKITEWRERVTKKQELLHQEVLTYQEKYHQRHHAQAQRLADSQTKKLLMEAALEKSTQELAATYKNNRSFSSLLTQLTRE